MTAFVQPSAPDGQAEYGPRRHPQPEPIPPPAGSRPVPKRLSWVPDNLISRHSAVVSTDRLSHLANVVHNNPTDNMHRASMLPVTTGRESAMWQRRRVAGNRLPTAITGSG